MNHIWEIMVVQWSCHWLVKGKYNPQGELWDCQFHLHAWLDHAADRPENCANNNMASLMANCTWQMTNLVVFYNGITAMVDKGIEAEAIYLNLYKKFDTLPQDIFVCKLWRHGFDRWVNSKHVKNWLDGYI